MRIDEMTSGEFEAAIRELGLNQIQAARFLEIGERTSRRYCNEQDPPFVVAALLRVMLKRGITVRDVNKIMGRK